MKKQIQPQTLLRIKFDIWCWSIEPTIRIKNQSYCSKPAIALYIRDYTKKIQEKLFRMKVQEKKQIQ